MTTKPRVKKFRLRRSEPAPQADPPAEEAQTVAPVEPVAPEPAGEDDLAAIRQEGLTGRQLRMARRVAHKHGLAVTSDFDAVRQLRQKGVDPFQRSAMLELAVSDGTAVEGAEIKLPQTADAPKLPSTEVLAEERRAKEIVAMQRDIVRRRQRRFGMLMARLAVFVLLPTLACWYYYARIATPLYATKAELVIQQADAQSAGSVGGLFSGTSLATATDSITVQSFLQSREAMLQLDRDLGFRGHFSQPQIDPILRIEADSSNEAAYKLYKKNVKIGYDPTEGVIRMEVIAADPETSVAFANALVGYAEEQVDSLTQRKREDQMDGAMAVFEDAQQNVMDAQAEVLRLQEQMGVLDPVAESTLFMGQISTFDTQLREKRLQLEQLLDNPRPNQARVAGVQGDIERLEATIADLRSQLTESRGDNGSLARVAGQLRMAEANLQSRQLLLQSALQQVETARIEANRQVRYLSMGVRPVAADEPTYPRVFENTMLAFLVFGGIYLMASLTASILREQVTA